ncbi:O-antigen ligase family protein [Mariniflexile fucanivorans]|uniref:O-antigen ligase family protein n=1 Tax=Mariniflexile fucanivorans TaxID=264023 RepID=UPI001A9F6EBB|nr:O-antigen ligase family protein [Mariniflexile fucanivorans]
MIPSLLLPIKYSSILLVILFLIVIYKLITKQREINFPKILLLPFIIYYISIIISFLIDVYFGIINFDFLLRNLVIIIVPLFVFTSNLNEIGIKKMLNISSIIISSLGVVFILLWVTGYMKYFNQQEFKKNEWIKSGITSIDNYKPNDSVFEFEIGTTSKTNSFRKVGSLSKWNKKDSVIRELTIKVKKSNQDVWVYFRNFNKKQSQGAWFNAKTGQIGLTQKGIKAETKLLPNGYFKFILKDKPQRKSTREWFHFSLVSENGGNKWYAEQQKSNKLIQLLPPKFYLSSGQDLLQKKSLLSYKITSFSSLHSYAHGTYMSLVFTFSLMFLLFNQFLNKWIRYLFIAINIFIIFSLASKAVIISLIILFPIYYYKCIYRNKYTVAFCLICFIVVLIGFKGYAIDRFVDMYKTLTIDNKGDLENLSTNERIHIYENYYNLIDKNYWFGYGNINGKNAVKTIYNHDFNTHNQYIQSLFNSGFLGFLLFILFCLSPFILIKSTINNRNEYMFFLLIVLFNFLFESLLYRQWGLILVSFIFAIYLQTFKLKLRWSR